MKTQTTKKPVLDISLNFLSGGCARFMIPLPDHDDPAMTAAILEVAKEQFEDNVFYQDEGTMSFVDHHGLKRLVRCAHVTMITFNN